MIRPLQISGQSALSWQARERIEEAGTASCYYCIRYLDADEIKEWVDDELTAICPLCGIDAVVAGKIPKRTLKQWCVDSFKPAKDNE